MDLLRIVLAYLPYGRAPDDNVVRTRLVNRIENGDFPYTYGAICTYQGELSDDSVNWMERKYLCSRAAFLGDVEMFKKFSNSRQTIMDFEIGMRSNVPEIQLLAARSGAAVGTINDPEVIRWDPELRSILLNRALDMIHGSGASFLYGYLFYPEHLSVSVRGYRANLSAVLEGYVTAAIGRITDPFTPDPLIEEAGQITGLHHNREHLIKLGYFITTGVNLTVDGLFKLALSGIQPRLLISLLVRYPEHKDRLAEYSRGVNILRGMEITERVVDRARAMLELEVEFADKYQIGLLIVTGGFCFTPDHLMTLENINLMVRVAHPQLTKELIGDNVLDEDVYGTVFYDLVNLFRVFDPKPKNVSQHLVHELIARGQLWQIEGTKLFRKLTNVAH